MHFEILVEDASGKIALEAMLEKILTPNSEEHSYRIRSYKRAGHIPKDLIGGTDPQKRILLDRLPKMLRGYGKSLQHMHAAVIVVVDLDNRDCINFKEELVNILDNCNPRPNTLFRIAIEEGEAWLLGDRNAVEVAYPNANNHILDGYEQDSICGTWEILADAIYHGGATKLRALGWPHIGQAKCKWAKEIAPHVNVEVNLSKSFQVFRDGIRRLAVNDVR